MAAHHDQICALVLGDLDDPARRLRDEHGAHPWSRPHPVLLQPAGDTLRREERTARALVERTRGAEDPFSHMEDDHLRGEPPSELKGEHFGCARAVAFVHCEQDLVDHEPSSSTDGCGTAAHVLSYYKPTGQFVRPLWICHPRPSTTRPPTDGATPCHGWPRTRRSSGVSNSSTPPGDVSRIEGSSR